jgi:hypothetical protein
MRKAKNLEHNVGLTGVSEVGAHAGPISSPGSFQSGGPPFKPKVTSLSVPPVATSTLSMRWRGQSPMFTCQAVKRQLFF